jgi:hypothetical protein
LRRNLADFFDGHEAIILLLQAAGKWMILPLGGSMKTLSIFLLLLLFLTSQSQALTNAVAAEDAEFQAVTMIKVDARDEDGSLTSGYCNATLLSEKELVTAGHCLAHAWLLQSKNISIEIGKYKYRKDAQGNIIRIGYANIAVVQDTLAQFILPQSAQDRLRRQGYNAVLDPSEDKARIVLSKPIALADLQVTPAVLLTAAELQTVRQMGSSAQLLLVTVNPIAEISNNDTKRKALLSNYNWSGGAWIESRSNSRVEPLDSGAPLFVRINNQWKILGQVKGGAQSFFGDWDVFSLAQ